MSHTSPIFQCQGEPAIHLFEQGADALAVYDQSRDPGGRKLGEPFHGLSWSPRLAHGSSSGGTYERRHVPRVRVVAQIDERRGLVQETWQPVDTSGLHLLSGQG